MTMSRRGSIESPCMPRVEDCEWLSQLDHQTMPRLPSISPFSDLDEFLATRTRYPAHFDHLREARFTERVIAYQHFGYTIKVSFETYLAQR